MEENRILLAKPQFTKMASYLTQLNHKYTFDKVQLNIRLKVQQVELLAPIGQAQFCLQIARENQPVLQTPNLKAQ